MKNIYRKKTPLVSLSLSLVLLSMASNCTVEEDTQSLVAGELEAAGPGGGVLCPTRLVIARNGNNTFNSNTVRAELTASKRRCVAQSGVIHLGFGTFASPQISGIIAPISEVQLVGDGRDLYAKKYTGGILLGRVKLATCPNVPVTVSGQNWPSKNLNMGAHLATPSITGRQNVNSFNPAIEFSCEYRAAGLYVDSPRQNTDISTNLNATGFYQRTDVKNDDALWEDICEMECGKLTCSGRDCEGITMAINNCVANCVTKVIVPQPLATP